MSDVEVRLEVDGMKLHVRKFSGAASIERVSLDAPTVAQEMPASEMRVTTQAPATAAPAAESIAASTQGRIAGDRRLTEADTAIARNADENPIPSDFIAIRAPMLGRFFRAPSPTEPAYIEVGSEVQPDDTVCIIEVMKLFNTVKAGVCGTIAQINVANGDMVEHDAVLFLVKPE
jgi:acetyl-CoA carboxylase biotin carboxyl carrier protein